MIISLTHEAALTGALATVPHRLHLLALVRSFLAQLRLLLCLIATARVLLKMEDPEETLPAPIAPLAGEDGLDLSVWDTNPELEDPDIDPKDPFRPGTLNQVLNRLAEGSLSVGKIDALLFGSAKFGAPALIAAKLMGRYKVPPKIDNNKAKVMRESALRLLVCWLQKERPFVDPATVHSLKRFADTLKHKEPSFAEEIVNLVFSMKVRL